jgi:hypothetical protein
VLDSCEVRSNCNYLPSADEGAVVGRFRWNSQRDVPLDHIADHIEMEDYAASGVNRCSPVHPVQILDWMSGPGPNLETAVLMTGNVVNRHADFDSVLVAKGWHGIAG